jgi:hypothetical protein
MSTAYVVDPDKPMEIPILAGDEPRRQSFIAIKENTIKGIETRTPQPVPPGTTEAALPFVENIRDLPSKAYFLKTLDRPHYPDEDEKGIPPWAHRTGPGTLLPPAPPPKPKQEARNDGP